MKVRQAIIPAAGLGTRFLPVTKNIPKELLPLVHRPCLQQVIDEAIKAGVQEFIIVISAEKKLVETYFQNNEFLDEWLLKRHQTEQYQMLKSIERGAKYKFVIQEEPLGLGHAVLQAKDLVTDDFFFVLLPDDIIDAEVPVCQQLNQVFEQYQKPIVSVMEIAWEKVHRYGIVEAVPLSERVGTVTSIIEKPSRQIAPSNLAVIGRYLLPKTIFPFIQKTKPGSGGEIQLTDAIKELIAATGLTSYAFEGDRYDTGTPAGLLCASMAMALKHPDFRDEVTNQIKLLAAGL